VTAAKAPRELACGRRGRHPPRAAQTGSRAVVAQLFNVVKVLGAVPAMRAS
jgi:hypothetical protein